MGKLRASSKLQHLYWIRHKKLESPRRENTSNTIESTRSYELSACREVHVDFEINSRKWDCFL